ncbi:FKBP-type peptidyl-prolyl cis-trans isomerase [Hymenobacter endophyticus]|uniref:Peptidyl-prolyl cis-trans isomerase n=1 Tax=Hymenobacter endophyticus TaxID=3076335 RepID=A0ABU3TMH4_9BACT|nr:FKBP-type peptidyl-prolyl cis-trans isomerase [Hymenobacter endophyticus]MDU0372587.1 FKBP-type peptidyl-prolyl cis-trans isomerase [Hymenobacter endophyticus]
MKFRFSLPSVLLLGVVASLAACKDDDKPATPDYTAQDDAVIQQYIKDKSLTGFRKDTLDVYIGVTQPGTGPNAKRGKVVKVLYTGTLLDGTVFDSNLTTLGFPFTIGLSGDRGVINGWNGAFTRLNKGAKATLLIPSAQAYGSSSSGKIPANSVLRFDVEVVDIK